MATEKQTCLIEGCDHTVWCRGVCRNHYARAWHSGGLDALPRRNGVVSGSCQCGNPVYSRGLCKPCYTRMRLRGTLEYKNPRYSSPICAVEGCEKRRASREYCSMHGYRMKRYGEVGPVERIPYHKKPEEELRHNAVAILRQAGFTYEEIGVCLKVTKQRIEQIIKLNGK